MKTEIEELKEKIAALEAKIKILEARSSIEIHNHYHYDNYPIANPYYPPQSWSPCISPTCQSIPCGQATNATGRTDAFMVMN